MSLETGSLQVSSSIFFVSLSRKNIDRLAIILDHCFYFYKPQICKIQTGLTIWSVIPWKNLCNCIQKIKNKNDGRTDVAFFVFACITHSLVERLTASLSNKDKSHGNKDAQQLVKIYKCRLPLPYPQRNISCKMKEEITSQKKLFKVKK